MRPVHSLSASDIQVFGNQRINGYLHVKSGVNIGSEGLFSAGDIGAGRNLYVTGNLGLATTSPWRTLSTVGTLGLSSSLTSATTGNYLCINTSNYEVTSGTTCSASSERFKENIKPIMYGLNEILKLNPVSFTYKKEVNPNDQSTKLGFIAEQVDPIFPELVAKDKDGLPESVDYAKLAPVLTRAIQELDVKITTLVLNPGSAASILTDGATFRRLSSSLGQWSIDADGTLTTVKVVTDEIITKTLKAQHAVFGSQEKPEGITLYDDITSKPYCAKIHNGDWAKIKGECGTPTPSPSAEPAALSPLASTSTQVQTEQDTSASTSTPASAN